MKAYSPSSRVDYSFCPRYWYLRKRWQPRRVGYPEICGIGGTAVSEAMCYWNQARMATKTVVLEDVVNVGLQSIVTQTSCLAQAERRVTGLKDTEVMDGLPKLVEMACKLLWESNPLRDNRIIAAEHEFKDFGNARPDVISQNSEGETIVDDYKCKFSSFDEAWKDKEFDRHFDGEQRLAYTHMVGCTLFGIILVVLQPHSKRKPLKPFVERRISRVQPHEHKLWMNDAALDYRHMELVENCTHPLQVQGKASPHANQYGDCAFKEACCEEGLDEQRMQVRYTQITGGTK